VRTRRGAKNWRGGHLVEPRPAHRSATPLSGSTSPSASAWGVHRRKLLPSGNETAALLNTFAIFAAAFFMRPLPLGVSDETFQSAGLQ
jgi:hypothetical protein